MLKKLLCALPLAPLLVLLAGCCANTPCDCRDLLADSLYITFDNSFTTSELDTVYLARYEKSNLVRSIDSLPLPLASRVPTNLATQINTTGLDLNGLVVISNNAPFSITTTGANLSRYVYRLFVQRDGSRTAFYRYRFDRISLIGRYQADGCCTCYQNTQKRVRVNSEFAAVVPADTITRTITDTGTGGSKVPVLIRLSK